MRDFLRFSTDARQTPQWGKYLSSIGWDVEVVGKTQVFIKRIPVIGGSVIKIQHPKNPLPFKKIDGVAKRYHSLAVIIEPDTLGYKEGEFLKNTYRKSKLKFVHTATIKIDLTQSEKELLRSFSENARRNIRKAQTNDLIVKKIFLNKEADDSQFQTFYSLLKNLTRLKRFYIPSYEEYFKKMTAFKKSSILLFAYQKGSSEPIATIWLAYFDKTIAYFQTGITEKGYQTFANYLLVWEGLKLAKKLKLKVFDFEAIFDPRYPKNHKAWKNFTEFKKRFHGTIVEYPPVWIKFYNPLFKATYLLGTFFDNK